MGNPVHLLAFGFGSGLTPKAPGTFGTLVGVPAYLLLQPLSPVYYGFVVAAAFLAGIWLCGRTSRDLGVHDHGGIVWDEIVGYLVTMLWAPPGWLWMIMGFVLFRVFDIFKPWPIRWFDQKVSGGFGIMLDDLIAGLFAAALLFMIQRMGWF
ncbi:MAG: phosphatidylglycerophosphatase A [Candidatus Thiodiazotropha sp.]